MPVNRTFTVIKDGKQQEVMYKGKRLNIKF